MKIGVINSLYPPYQRGGAEMVAREEVEKFQKNGDDVFVITIKPWQGLRSLCYKLEKIDNIRVYRFFPLNLFSFININKKPFWLRLPWHLIDVFNFQSRCCVKRILKKERPDLVVTHNLKGIGYLTWWGIRSLGIKNIHILHDVQLSEPSGIMILGREKKHRFYARCCRWLIGSPAEVVSPSQWLMDFYISQGFFKNSQKKVNLAFGKLPVVEQLKLKPHQEIINFVYLGQIEDHKGILWLVKILQGLQNVNYKLQIVGEGSKLEEVKKIVKGDGRFKIYGWLEGEDKNKIISQSNFLIMPSLGYENSPTIIPLSLSLSTPVIAADIGGVGEMIKERVNGYLFKVGDEQDLRARLDQILIQ